MSVPSGALVTADEFNMLQSAASAMTGATMSLTASFQDVTGTSKSITVVNPNAVAIVTATFDVNPTVGTGNNVFVGILVVDGAAQTAEAHCDDRVSRVTCGQTYRVALTAGSHTLKLQAKKAGGTMILNPTHTTMTVTVFDLP